MPKPTEPLQTTLTEVARIAKEVTLSSGSHAPMLLVKGDRKGGTVPVPDMAETYQERAAQMFLLGWILAEDGGIGVLQQVFFITEGWMSKVENGQIPDTPPSRDPQRTEVLTVAGIDVITRQSQMTFFEMKRDLEGKLSALEALWENDGVAEMRSMESPLLEAFVAGFLGVAQEEDD